MSSMPPAYISAAKDGRLAKAVLAARKGLSSCCLCPRTCQVNRLEEELGVCRTGKSAEVSSCGAHFGEESPLVGSRGSGTIFFTRCNLLCVFCQNYDISHEGNGRRATPDELAEMMLALQEAGCHNINFVTPSHVVPQILESLEIAASKGLHIPLVYNTSGYDRTETLRLLDGIIDIYMPDFKFWRSDTSRRLCGAPDYSTYACAAIREMHRQVGDLAVGPDGIALRGLLLRHLVLPGGLADTNEIMQFIGREISTDTYVNIMAQYHPCGRAAHFPPLDRPPTAGEYAEAVTAAKAEGLTRIDRPVRRFIIE